VVILLLGVYLAWQGSVTLGSLVFAVTLSEKAYFSLYRKLLDLQRTGNLD
jgi:ABC-type bacteriocin/lantibiotic exporter with double-glycine peptidase domain